MHKVQMDLVDILKLCVSGLKIGNVEPVIKLLEETIAAMIEQRKE